MKTMKKLLALATAVVMMLAMTVTAFGATSETAKTTITVTNLSTREATQVSIYNVVELGENANSWTVADWAKDYVTLGENGAVAVFDWASLSKAAAAVKADESKTVTADSVTFDNVKTGAYLVIAAGTKVKYQVMGAVTYEFKDTNPYIVAKNATVVAKSETSVVEKEADDDFVAANQNVDFTLTTTIPLKKDTFEVYDTMTNLALVDGTVKVEIAGADVTRQVAVSAVDNTYTFAFAKELLTEANAGKTVVITYTAKVSGVNGYVNTTWNNTVDEKATVEGFTGDITLTKKDTEGKVLSGAKFTVVKEGSQALLSFVKVSDGVYELAEATENAVTEIEATNGTVQVKGLDEGTYYFTETVAPAGYSVNTTPTKAVVEKNENKNQNVSVTAEMIDSKLSALPFTGGMGTTLFTIVGCVVMILAAGLFFSSRKKMVK